MRDLKNKRALVTGAAAGIGRAIALELAGAGCDCCLLDVNKAALAEVEREILDLGVDVFSLECDIADPAAIETALESLLARWPDLDVLVNNAGVTFRGRSLETECDHWRRMLAVNLQGPIEITQRLLPVLLSRPQAHLVNICSLMGVFPFPKFSVYSATKYGLVGYTESLRAEYLGSQLGVSAICPGFVRTSFMSAVPTSRGRQVEYSLPKWLTTTPEAVAKSTLRAIRRDRGVVLVTAFAHIAWRLKRFLPVALELPRLFKNNRRVPAKPVATDSSSDRKRISSDRKAA